jgi:hypothetical protein
MAHPSLLAQSPRANQWHKPPLDLRSLMDASQASLVEAARSDGWADAAVAKRVLDTPVIFCRWESEHQQLMRGVATHRHRVQQAKHLLASAFSLIHRKALFDYLRHDQVRGLHRHRLITAFHAHRGYSASLVAEHGLYLRTTASLTAVKYLGCAVLREDMFDGALVEYEDLHAEYFKGYCEFTLMPEGAATIGLLGELKLQLSGQRTRLLSAIARQGQRIRPSSAAVAPG